MIEPKDTKEIERIVKIILTTVNVKKAGDSPQEFFDLVNKGYLQKSGTTTNRPAFGQTGRMYFNITTGKPNWDTGSGWVLADGTAA